MQYLYLIRSEGYFKIGIASDVESRLAQLQTGNPIQLQLVDCYFFKDAQAVERVLHNKFSKCRAVGEWFRLDMDQIETFRSICQMLDGAALIDLPQVDEEDIQEAEDTQEILLSGIEWRLDRRNGRGYAIFQRGGEKKYLGYVGKNNLKDWEHPTVEEIEAAIEKYGRGQS